MRLTFPVLTLSKGGAQRMLAELANRLAEIGHEVVVLMPGGSPVEYEMKCPVVFSSDGMLSENDFPYGDIIISNYYTTVPVAQRASEQGKGCMPGWPYATSRPFCRTIISPSPPTMQPAICLYCHGGSRRLCGLIMASRAELFRSVLIRISTTRICGTA